MRNKTELRAKSQEPRSEFDTARVVVARFVGYQMRSVHEVKQRLVRGGFSADTIDAVVEFFSEQGLLDDTGFALAFIQDKFRVAKHGRIRITHALRAKGIAADVIAAAFDKIAENPLEYIGESSLDEAELNNAAALVSQRLKGAEPSPEELKKCVAFLARRGYSRGVIVKCLNPED